MTQVNHRWLHSLDLDHAQVVNAVRAMPLGERAAVTSAARAPLGELLTPGRNEQAAEPRPVSQTLAQSGCVFTLTLNEGEYPSEHHWLTHLGWAAARHMQPRADWDMPPQAVDLDEALSRHQEQLTAEMGGDPTHTLGLKLHRTIHQLTLFTQGDDPEYWLFTRVCQSVLCGLIDARAQGSPLAEGGYDDAAAAMLRQAIITAEDDDAAFDLADRAQVPEAYQARHRAIADRAPF